MGVFPRLVPLWTLLLRVGVLGVVFPGRTAAPQQFLPEDLQALRCIDPDSDLVVRGLEDRDDDVITNKDPFPNLPSQNQHSIPPAAGLRESLVSLVIHDLRKPQTLSEKTLLL